MAKSIDLDETALLASTDPAGMLGVIEDFPGQLERALEIGAADIPLPSGAGISSVVVLGMGGSGISGDVARVLAPAGGLKVPVIVSKGYRLPGFVGPDTLLFAVSYSGDTEETLAALDQAIAAGARTVAISSGGKLSALARSRGIPLFHVPGGMQPRASLGYLFVPILSALERMGLVSGLVSQIAESVSMLSARSLEHGGASPTDMNHTKRLAKDLVDCLPVVYGAEGPLGVAALRWKAQLNEMAKVPAFWNEFPELNHNETVGWLNLREVCSRTHIIVLREENEHEAVEKRIKVTVDLLDGSVQRVTHVFARGDSVIGRFLDLVYFGDFVAVYLALALREDPTPVARIQELKRRLAE